jgi:hypothetical protein
MFCKVVWSLGGSCENPSLRGRPVHQLIQFFGKFFSFETRKSTASNATEPRNIVIHTHVITAPALLHVNRRLEQVGQLLLTPTPEAVRDATLLLEEAIAMLRSEGSSGLHDRREFSEQVKELERTMERTRRLIEGALRVQWVRLRKITAVTQGYAPGGKPSKWQPSAPTVNFQV